MSNIAIPNLPAVTSLNGTELVLGVQSNTSVKITTQQIANFTATSSNNYVNTLSFGTTGLTPAGVVGGNITVAGTLNVANGGTGVTTFGATNTLLYTTSANNISSIAAGTVDQILAVNSSGVPYWRSTIPATAGVDSISFGTTGLTPSTNTSGIVTVSGTLAIGSGGTGITSFGTGVQTALGQNVTGSGGIVLATAPTIANPVITGGSINNTPIGATTASTGAFSYLSTSSSTSTTPVLSFNASNSPIAAGASISGSYLQFVLQNKSATAGASTNYVLSNDSGTDSAFYGEFGMNSSVYSASTPGDFFSINNGVYFSAHDGDVSIGSGNGYKVYFPWGGSATSAHVINASGALGFSTNLGATPTLSGTTGFGTSGQALITGGSAAAPAWGTLGVSGGGTGQSAALTQYGIVYGASTTAMGITAAGTTGQVLLANTGGAPTWGTAPAAGVTSISFGTTGLTPSSATTGAIVVAGTLVATSGGTGQSSYTVGDILYASGATTLSKLAAVATGSVLVSGGVGVAPAYSATPTVTSLTASTSLTSPIHNSSTTLSLQTGGTTGLYIDASQNVGIGTTSPSGKLDISTGTIATAINSNNQTDTGFVLKYASALTSLGNNFNQPLAFLTNNTERMRINSSGNVGIGVTPNAWSTVTALQMAGPSLWGSTVVGHLSVNTYFDGTNYKYINTDAAMDYYQLSGTHVWRYAASGTAGTNVTFSEAMRIDSSGNVGIGTTSPGAKLDVQAGTNAYARVKSTSSGYALFDIDAFTANQPILRYLANGTESARIFSPINEAANQLSFATGSSGTERMRIDSSGNLLVGTTSLPVAATRVGISGSSGVSVGVVSLVNTNASTKKWSTGPDANGNFIVYNDALVGMYLGYGNNAWTASSDERVKTDLVPIENAAAKVSLLRAVTGRFKTDEEGKSRSFLIAQDVQAVLPEAVDASDPDKLGVQYTDVIPLLVAAIKELSAEVEALKAKVGA